MGKRILISENEKKHIKKLYKIDESFIDDILDFVKTKGSDAIDKVKDFFDIDDSEDEEKTDKQLEDEIEKMSDDKKEKIKKELLSTEVSKTSNNEYAIIKPNGYSGKKVHVLFGGSHTSGYSKNSANPSAIKKYINVMSPYANNVIIVVTHHMNTLNNVREYVKNEFGGVVSSIAGFSQGGREAWEHADDGSLNLVGLIDPSTYETGISFGPNTVLYCDPKNWGTSGFYGQTRKRLEWYCDNKKQYGNKVICFNKGGTHMNFSILKSFYDEFGGRL